MTISPIDPSIDHEIFHNLISYKWEIKLRGRLLNGKKFVEDHHMYGGEREALVERRAKQLRVSMSRYLLILDCVLSDDAQGLYNLIFGAESQKHRDEIESKLKNGVMADLRDFIDNEQGSLERISINVERKVHAMMFDAEGSREGDPYRNIKESMRRKHPYVRYFRP